MKETTNLPFSAGDAACTTTGLEFEFISRIRFLSVSAVAKPCFTFVLNIRPRSSSISTIKNQDFLKEKKTKFSFYL